MDRHVVSNTPVMMSNEETAVLPSGRKERRRRWRFAETPVMSTYLLALVRLLVVLGLLWCSGGGAVLLYVVCCMLVVVVLVVVFLLLVLVLVLSLSWFVICACCFYCLSV